MSSGVITRVATLRHRFTASLHDVILLLAAQTRPFAH